jgi:hypothetical protein
MISGKVAFPHKETFVRCTTEICYPYTQEEEDQKNTMNNIRKYNIRRPYY